MIGKPYSGKPNVRFDEGELEIEPFGNYASSLLYWKKYSDTLLSESAFAYPPTSHDSQIARIKTFLSISNAVGRKETLTEMPLVLNTTATGENEIDDSKKSIEHETFRRMG